MTTVIGTLTLVYHQSEPHEIPPDQPQIDPQQDLQEPRRSDRSKRPPDRLGAQPYNAEQPLAGENDVTRPWWPHYPREED